MSTLKHIEGIVGRRHGRWIVLADLGTFPDCGTIKRKVTVKCDCGTVRDSFYAFIKSGVSKSCGCFRKEKAAALIANRVHKHNLSKHPLYQIWRGMKCRCYNETDKAYIDYGGRGITVCDEWRNDFKSFYNWAIENGWKKGLINDRSDNDKGYSPDNCRFVNDGVSMRNTRRNVNITYNGVTKCITDWANDIGISVTSVQKRLKIWGDLEKVLTTPKTTK